MVLSGTIEHFPVTVNEEELEKGVLLVLQNVRPNWNFDDVRLKLLTDGLTNKLMKCHEGTAEHDVILVRVYGKKTDLFIDRTAETRNIILLHEHNLAPRLYATFNNGLAYEFVPGSKMAKLHKVRRIVDNKPEIWAKIDKFYDLVPDKFTKLELQKRISKTKLTKFRLQKEIVHLKETLGKLDSPIVFCHNDLLLGNVIYNSDNESVTFIDYEYAGMNYQAFDIGNHFNEFAGVENIDYTRYPGRAFQTAWLYEYLRVYHGHDDISFKEIDELYVMVNKFGLLSHVLWGLWGLIQAEESTIEFDFLQFAFDHLNRYFKTKDEFLSLKPDYNKECQMKTCQL